MRSKITGWTIGLAVSLFVCPVRAELIGHWTLDETSGTVATDSSGKGHHGTYVNNPGLNVPGALATGTGMNAATGYMVVDLGSDLPVGAQERTIALWLKPVTNNIDRKFCAYGDAAAGGAFTFTIEPVNNQMGVRLRHWGGNYTYPGVILNEWQHITMLVPPGSARTSDVRVYLNGVNAPGTMTGSPDRNLITGRSPFYVGTVHISPGSVFDGTFDDVWFFNHALTGSEIADVIAGGSVDRASSPVPASAATDVPREVVLGWTAGKTAAMRDVYFGVSVEAVQAADRANPMNVLLSQGQAATTFAPSGLVYGRTYYWRVDEVGQAPDNTIFKGDVWSFTVEPYAYPIKPVAATASSAQVGMGPEKTIDGSGLTGDLHGTEPTTMWLSAGAGPNWIQYEFDKVGKLHELWVWNSNQLLESFLGFGAKSVTIETSTDGTAWTPAANVPEFARASSAAGYAVNTVASLGGVSAKYVKLTIQSTWGGMSAAGLSEVRFFYVPVQAREPVPANAATGVDLDATLTWRPGREAASHAVYLGTDRDAVANGTVAATTVSDHHLVPGSLDFGTTYFWKVDEVNAVTYPGELWSFSTQEYAIVEDFESYTDEEGSRIYETWIDGWENKTGSVVGYLQAPFAERTVLHGGRQSMPLEYNNLKTPFYSETERTFSPTQDWTTNSADTLSLWVRGRPVAFLDKSSGAFTVSASGHDIWDNADDFRFVYKRLSGNGSVTVKVDSLVNTHVWAKAGVMIRESLEAASPMAYMIQSFDSGVSFGWRQTQGAGAASVPATTGLVAPRWVKLTRTGNAFTAQHSADGTIWTDIRNADGTVASTTINMAGTVYIGLCVTSHNTAATTTAQFSGAATTGGVTGAWQPVWIGDDPDLTNGAAGLYVAVEDSTGKSAVVVHPDPAAAASGAWTQWKIPLSSFAGVNLIRVKKLYLGVGDRKAPAAGGAGILYIDDIGFGHPLPAK